MMGRGDEGRYRYVPLGTPRVRAARERWVRERRGVGGGVATQHCALVRPDEGRDGGAGTGRRAGGTRRGGRRLSEGQGWSAQRQAYEVGLALERVVRQVEIEEVGGSGEIGEISYWNNPFLLPSRRRSKTYILLLLTNLLHDHSARQRRDESRPIPADRS